ncbi:MAG: response regulator [Armatimonadetes bacterium]|nr:response regulator [Armatimonadota bacterium]
MAEPVRVVVIDDEVQIRRFLKAGLGAESIELFEAETGEEGLRIVARANPDVVLLDLGLPDMDGLEVARRLREWTDVPIIVLSARGQEKDKIAALDAGADDYLTKPFGVGELMARIRVTRRHAARLKGAEPEPLFEAEGLRVDLAARLVFLNGSEVKLTPIEYRLLACLVRNAGMVLTHRHLLTEVWGPAYADELHYLRVYMAQLRHKLERDPARPKLLTTESGVGYRLRVEG